MPFCEKSADFNLPKARAAAEGEPFFINPIGEKEAPDPFVTFDRETGFYYLLYTRGRELRIFRSRRINDITGGENVAVFTVNENDGIFGSIWAPEMHKIGQRWYIYTSGSINRDNKDERSLFIMRSLTADPFDGFEFAGIPEPELRAIDPTVYEASDGSLYMCYAAEGRGNRLHIRKMSSPTSFESGGHLICEADRDWETVAPYTGDCTIVEGASFVSSPDGRRLFIIYSANGCWSDFYRLGILEFTGNPADSGARLDDPKLWVKNDDFIFGPANGSFGPGHASYFSSPDRRELWIAYHAMHQTNPAARFAPRYLHIQRVYFDASGFPVLGEPLPMGRPYAAPGGEPSAPVQPNTSAYNGNTD